MLTSVELRQAELLFEKLREVTQPALPEFTKDGKELAELLHCSRTKSWQITKRRRLQRRGAVRRARAEAEAQADPANPRMGGGPGRMTTPKTCLRPGGGPGRGGRTSTLDIDGRR